MLCKRLLDSLTLPEEPPELSADSSVVFTNGADLPAGDYGFALIKLFLSLIVVAALLGLTLWFLRKLIRFRLEKSKANFAIQVLEKKMISPKTMLYFIEIEGEKIILAESQLEVRQITPMRESAQALETPPSEPSH